ncbi:MAG: MoaD/ThiS family protein [Methanobacteriota archaeon]|nr:MAG: MoaD/ThiS family protein [Euryarchaeota archaeon]
MPIRTLRTSFAGTLIVVSAGTSDCFARASERSRISWESISSGERAPVHNPSPSARIRRGQPKAFHPGTDADGGKVVATRASSDEIARTGVTVRIPPALRSYTDGQDEVVLEADDVASLLRSLDRGFPGIRDRVVDEAGQRRQYVNIFVNEDLLWSSLPEARLRRGDVVHILPSVAGG